MLVAEVLGVDRLRAHEIVAAFGLGMHLGPVEALDDRPMASRPAYKLPAAPLPRMAWELFPMQRDYVRSRGISDEHARLFGLGTVLSDGSQSKADKMLTGRVLFPIWGPSGRVVFWAARDASGRSSIKILNTPRSCREEGHSEHCTCYHDAWGLVPVAECATADEVVLGAHLVEEGGTVIVVEGPTDAAVCGPGFVATLRSWCSPAQAAWIGETGAREAVILYDGDPPDAQGHRAGPEGAIKAYEVLRHVLPTRIAACPEGEDPGSLGRRRSLEIAMAAPRSGGIGQLEQRRYTRIPSVQRSHPLQSALGGRDPQRKLF